MSLFAYFNTSEYVSMRAYIISIHVYAIYLCTYTYVDVTLGRSYLHVFTDCANASCHSRMRDLRCPRWLLPQRQHLLSGRAEGESYAAKIRTNGISTT